MLRRNHPAETLARPLTSGERASLSAGLWPALERAGASPLIVGADHWMARLSRLWRGHVPILTLGERIFWLGAPQDCSAPGLEPHMAVLQHELQHVLEFSTGELTLARYALNPRNWTYAYRVRPGRLWREYGAEQRASLVEDLWRMENGQADPGPLAELRALIPWTTRAEL